MTSADSAPLADAEGESAARPATCHVVTLNGLSAMNTRAAAWTATSRTLPEEDVLAVKDAAAVWRDWGYTRKRLEALVARNQWPGLVVVYVLKNKYTVPRPLEMPIEPLELNEGDPAIRAIAERDASPGTASETSLAFRAWRRVLARVGTGFIGFISPLINAIAGLAMRNWWQLYINAGIMAVGMVIFAVIWWLTSAQWFIVPGGLIRRRGVVGKLGVQLTRFRPAGTIMVVRPFPPAGWSASFVCGDQHLSLRLTTTELSAVLAAWQSPLPCPAVEQLDDLR